MGDIDYAGFWLRAVAFIIDAIVLSVIYLLLIIPLYGAFVPDQYYENPNSGSAIEDVPVLSLLLPVDFSQLILVLVAIFYFTVMEASRHQASLGKIALELKVTDASGGRLTFSRAMLRNASKMISLLLLMIGYVFAAFTKRKQALHDLIAGAVVIKK
jgi:uncharacterized RDD family membrane protein YckC